MEQDQAAVRGEGQQHEQQPRWPRIDADSAALALTLLVKVVGKAHTVKR